TLKTAGSQSVTATDAANGAVTGSQAGIRVSPAAAAFLVLSGLPSSVNAGAAGTVTVTLTAKDAYGNVATGYTGTVRLGSSDPQAVLPASYAFTAADAGSHTFVITFKTAGTQSVTAADTANPSLAASQAGITVTNRTPRY